MAEKFDPYQAWLGIPPEEQPPNHYRLLGLEPFEEDTEVIERAADQRVGNLHAFQKGERAELALHLLNEVAVAKVCLMNPNRKAAYDKGLQERLQVEAAEAGKAEQIERARCERFLGLLEQRDLLSADLRDSLRKQVFRSAKPIPAVALAKRLVDKGHLTPPLAKQLLAAASQGIAPPAKPKPEAKDLGLAPVEEEELGFAPLEEDRPAARRVIKKDQKPPPAEPGQPQRPAAAPASGSLLDEELPPLDQGLAGVAGGGPLDGLMADSALGAEAAAAGSPLATPVPKKKGLRALFAPRDRRKIRRRANVWDSPLLLVGGGTLLVLVVLGGVLLWALFRRTGHEALRQANEDYRAGSYKQAIHKYTQYLDKFPSHSDVGLAKVNRGLAQLRLVTARGTTDWHAALKEARDVLGTIAREPEFEKALGDLSSMLLEIADGLAKESRRSPDRAVVVDAREALDLLKKYVPEIRKRRGGKIAEIEALLNLTEREIARGEELEKAITAMKAAVGMGDTRQAYEIRKALLRQYQGLADDEKLKQAMLEVSRAQQAAVRVVDRGQAGQAAEPDTEVLSTVVFAHRTTKSEVPGMIRRMVFASAAGAVYGLEATTGHVRWRRFVGFATNGRSPGFPPTPISPDPGSDALLVDTVRNEVLRVDGATGRVIGENHWRHSIGERFDAHPVVAGEEVLVATPSGRLVRIDAASGSSFNYIKLPQPLHVAPAVDLRRSLIFQVADQYNLFVLSLADGTCRQVVHLGHEPGSINAPPVVVSRLLLVAVNDRSRDSTLHVLTIDETEQGPRITPTQQFRLEGHVDTAPLVASRRVMVVTDCGVASVFELSGADPKKPLRKFPQDTVAGQEDLIRFALMEGSHFWIADAQLTKYAIQAARRQLVPQWESHKDSVFLQPPVAFGEAIFHVRRTEGLPGVFVAAVGSDEPTPFWETHLAVPLPRGGVVDLDGTQVTAVTSMGGLLQADTAAGGRQTIVDQPLLAAEAPQVPRPITSVIRLEGGLLALSAGEGSDQIAVVDPRQRQLRWLKLPEPLACPPGPLDGGLLAPLKKVGQVFLMDPRTDNKLAEPFQPRLQSGAEVAWQVPTPVGATQALVADGSGNLYLLGIKQQPRPDLTALKQAELAQPIVSPLGVVGNVAYAVDAAGVLAAFTLPELSRREVLSLAGKCVWGPQRVGQHVLLATDDDRLFCLDSGGKLVWQKPLFYGPLAGALAEAAGNYVLAATGGVVWRIDAASGEQLGKIETGLPLGTGPLSLGTRLLLGGHDGILYVVKRP